MSNPLSGQQILEFGAAVARQRRREAESSGLPLEDVVGAAVLGELEARRRHAGHVRPGSYWWRTARNAAGKALERERRHHRDRDEEWFDRDADPQLPTPTVTGVSTGLPADRVGEDLERRVVVARLLDALDAEEHATLTLSLTGMNQKAIAKALTCRKATVGNRLAAIRQAFRAAFPGGRRPE